MHDSVPPAMRAELRNQIACVLHTSEGIINAKCIEVQMQDGSGECGILQLYLLQHLLVEDNQVHVVIIRQV